MTLEITQQDIDNSERFTGCKACPIARALQRVTGNPEIEVGMSMVFIANPFKYLYRLSQDAKDFAFYYDMGHKVRPTTVEIEEWN